MKDLKKINSITDTRLAALRQLNETDAYIRMDIAGNISEMNSKAKQLFGYDIEKEQFNVSKMIVKDDFAFAMKSYARLVKRGEMTNSKARIATKSGAVKYVEFHSKVIYNDNKKPVAAHAIFRELKSKNSDTKRINVSSVPRLKGK